MSRCIYLWRHGQADKDSPTGKDEDRALSPEGRNELIEVADCLFVKKSWEKPEKIFASPFARARESAEMLQGFLACPEGYEVLPELKSGTAAEALISAVKRSAGTLRCFALVGHMPDLGHLAEIILGRPDDRISLKAGGVLKMELASLEEPFHGGALLEALNPADLSG
jgi:phosphohistidine phosphatase